MAICTLIGLLFVAAQAWYTSSALRKTSQEVEGSAITGSSTLLVELDRVFVEHPEIRRYFYRNESVQGAPRDMSDRVEAVAELMMDTFDSLTGQIGPSGSDQAAWHQYFVDAFRQAPALRAFLSTHCDWYSAEDWSDVVKELLPDFPGVCPEYAGR